VVDLKIWWVMSSAQYYPGLDNFISSHHTEQEAIESLDYYKYTHDCDSDFTSIIDITDRIIEREENAS